MEDGPTMHREPLEHIQIQRQDVMHIIVEV